MAFQKGHKINSGRKPWNTGLTKYTDERLRAIAKRLKGHKAWNKGKKSSEETKKKISENHKGMSGKYHSKETKRKIGLGNKGKKRTEEYKKQNRLSQLGKRLSEEAKRKLSKATSMEKNPNWRGGISFEPYGLAFNKKLKEMIRRRDNYRCQQCFREQNELRTKTNRPYNLMIHHIDFNKKNNNPLNLISLCRNCHAQTNYNREEWTNYFQDKVIQT